MLRCLLVAALAAPPPAATAAPGPSTPATPPVRAGSDAAAPPSTTPAGASSSTRPSGVASTPSTPSSSGAASTSTASTSGAASTSTASPSAAASTSTVSPSAGPRPAPAPVFSPAIAEPAPRGRLELQSSRAGGGPVSVRTRAGDLVATVQLQQGSRAQLDLPPGDYLVDDTTRGGRITLSVEPDRTARFELTDSGARGSAGEGPPPVRATRAQYEPRRWKRVGAPLLSAVIPGLGQIVNGQPGKGVGILFGAVSLAVGAAVLRRTSGHTDVSSRGLDSDSFGTEIISAAGYGLLSGGLQMLYAAQIMEAHATAAGLRAPRPRTRHRIALELTRMATVGLRPGDPAAGFFPDWSLSVLGQVARRLSVGVGDLSVKQGHAFNRTTLQGGVRVHYRFYDRGRVWLGAAAGLILQGSFGRSEPALVPATSPAATSEGAFAAIPYGQLDARFFILNRWSLNLTPRISAPLAGPRFFNGPDDRAVSRNAITLELGTGVGVYF